jgi:hypothetical protein
VLVAAAAIGTDLYLGYWDRLRSAPLWSASRAELAHYYLFNCVR